MPATLQTYNWVMRPFSFLEACMAKFGDIFTLDLLIVGQVVFEADPETHKQIFTADPKLLHAGEANRPAVERIVGQHSVLVLDEAEHLRQRRLMLPSFHGERMQRYGDLMASVTDAGMERWPVGEPFSLHREMQSITLDVILRAVFGLEGTDHIAAVKAKLLRVINYGLGRTQIGTLPWLRRDWGKRSREAHFKRAMGEFDATLQEEIARRRQDPATAERDDILSMLLQARDEQGDPMTDQELRDELVTLIVAGHETSATSLSWAFDLLFHNPEAMERLEAELAAGSQEYLDAVVKETLRLRPVLPIVARMLKAPMEVKGYELPEGSVVAPCIYLTHRLPDIYPEPDRFRPERFLEQPAGTYSWMPFGGGIRRCLGASFAQFEMSVVLRTVLERATLRATSEHPEKVRRRAITLAPEHGTMAVLERLEPRRTAAPARPASVAA